MAGGYVWDNSSWRSINSAYFWNNSAWTKITSGWMWDGSVWKQILSSGTFFPEVRNSSGSAFTTINVGIGMYGYRGSDVSGTYVYQWQYAADTPTSWYSQTGTNNSGTLTGTTTTTPYYYTSASDLSYIASSLYHYQLYMRLRVIKGTETQFSQVVQVTKRQASLKILTVKAATAGTAGASTVFVASTTGITAGQYINGIGIGNNAYVSGVTNSTTLAVSPANVSTVTGNDLIFDGPQVRFVRYQYVPGVGALPFTYSALASYSSDGSDSTPAYSFSFNNAKAPQAYETLTVSSNWNTTKVITNDSRPDYYIYTYRAGSGTTIKDSRVTDSSAPGTPTNASQYSTVPADVYSPVTITIDAYTSNPLSPKTLTLVSRTVSSGALTPPSTLTIGYKNGSLQFSWDSADGGNTNPIYYTVYLERSGSLVYTSAQTTSLSATYATSVSGSYRFQVGVTQAGSSNVGSGYSNYFLIEAPKTFTYAITNSTNDPANQPGDFTISAPVASTTVLNRYDWTWSASSTATSYSDTIYRPDGTSSPFTNSIQPAYTDYWPITVTGSYKLAVTASQKTNNYFTLTWDKPTDTTAISYRINYTYYTNNYATTVGPTNLNVEDITSYTWTLPYKTDYIFINSITAYSLSAQNVSSLTTTISTTKYATGYITGSKTVERTDTLNFLAVTHGSASVSFSGGTPTPEVGCVLTVNKAGYIPDPALNSNWTFTYQWWRSAEPLYTAYSISGATNSTYTTGISDTGCRVWCVVSSNYLGNTGTATAPYVFIDVPPPTFTLTDNGFRNYIISSVSINATGTMTYSGADSYSNSIPSTLAGVSYTSLTKVPSGYMTVTLSSKAVIARQLSVGGLSTANYTYNSPRSTTNNITIQPGPQDTGSIRSVYLGGGVVNPGAVLYVSTNGYLTFNTVPSTSWQDFPATGSFLNVAGNDLVQTSLKMSEEIEGIYFRWRGYRYGTTNYLEYEVFYPWGGYYATVYFVQNDLASYVTNRAKILTNVTQSNYNTSSVTSYTPLSTFRIDRGQIVDVGSYDDGYTSITGWGRFPNITVDTPVKTDGGFTFNVTNYNTLKSYVSNGTFASSAYFNPSVTGASVTVSTAGLVTVTGLAVSTSATVVVTVSATSFYPKSISVTGQSMDPIAPYYTVAPTYSGTAEAGTSMTYTSGTWKGIPAPTVASYHEYFSYPTSGNTYYANPTSATFTTTNVVTTTNPLTVSALSASKPSFVYRGVVIAKNSQGTTYWTSNGVAQGNQDTGILSFMTPTVSTPTISTPTNTGFKVTWTAGVNGSPSGYASYITSKVEIYDSNKSLLATVNPATSPYTWTGGASNKDYYVKVYVTANDTSQHVVDSGYIAAASLKPVVKTASPTISGGTSTGTDVSFSAGTYDNAKTITTALVTTTNGNTPTSGSFSSNSGTKSPTGTGYYTIAGADADNPPFIFATRDTVLGLDGNTTYFYSGGGSTTALSTVTINSGSGAIVSTLATGTAPTFGTSSAVSTTSWKALITNWSSTYSYSVTVSTGSGTVNSSGEVVVTGLTASTSPSSTTATVTVKAPGYTSKSATATGTPSAAVATTTIPNAPGGVYGSNDVSPTGGTFYWNASTVDASHSAAVSYEWQAYYLSGTTKVYYPSGTTSTTWTSAGSNTSQQFKAARTFYFSVRARNSAGVSSASGTSGTFT
jgi:hypothetical protein